MWDCIACFSMCLQQFLEALETKSPNFQACVTVVRVLLQGASRTGQHLLCFSWLLGILRGGLIEDWVHLYRDVS